MFEGKFVNLVDLVDTGNTGQCATQFDTFEKLKEYTIKTGKFFPKSPRMLGGCLSFSCAKFSTSMWVEHRVGSVARH